MRNGLATQDTLFYGGLRLSVGREKSVRRAARPDADIYPSGTSGAVPDVSRFFSIDVNPGIDVATLELDADIPPLLLLASTPGFPWRAARNVDVLSLHNTPPSRGPAFLLYRRGTPNVDGGRISV